MLVKAPHVTSLRITILSANQVQIDWDDVGENFYYIVEYCNTRDQTGTPLPEDQRYWFDTGITPDNSWFQGVGIEPNSYYQFRVNVSAKGFTPSDWVYTEEFQTFKTNAYYVSTMKEFIPAKSFIQKKFTENDVGYINFNNDTIMASLMKEDFVFSPEYSDISNISDKIVTEEDFHEIQDHIEPVCVDINRTMLSEIDGVLYLFERFQPMAKVSNDKGQNWKYYKALNGRVGNPVSRVCTYQSDTTTYILGYEHIYYGRRSSDTRFSADDVRFSNNEITFAKIGDTLNLGFDVELFNEFARLPGDMNRRTEAMACTNEYLYVGAQNKLRRIKLVGTPVDTDPGSPTFGQRIFEKESIQVTQNPLVVIKKMDVLDGNLFVLVSGQLKSAGLDPTVSTNITHSDDSGVYMLNTDKTTFTRVFGNGGQQLRYIVHDVINMSTDGNEIFISEINFEFPDVIPDPETSSEYSVTATKYLSIPGYNSDTKIYMGTFRAHKDTPTVWELGPQRYYNEAAFTWMARGGTRCWITNTNKPLVVYPEIVFTAVTDKEGIGSPDRINKEVYNRGHVTLYMNNVSFKGFKRYANGIMFHKNTGEIIGFYEFPYRTIGNTNIFWKPDFTMMVLELQNQTREVPWSPEHPYGLVDPDLRPLITKMMPDSYLNEDTNFEKFSEYYLQFLSDGNGTYYNKLLNLIKNKYPREQYAYEYLWSEINKRNIYLDKAKKDEVVRLFESRSYDFYSTKGIENSYKFLFKLLYNEDVEIDIESKQGIDYDIVVYSDNISQDLVGRTIYTPTGRANVTYIDREYQDGKLQWRLTIHNMYGKFYEGQVVKSERTAFTGMIIVGVRGKDLAHDSIEYINRSRSYYVMKIKSELPLSRYRQDVVRFVHPVGFGFIGITLLTIFINSGLSMKQTETIINTLKAYRFDSGYPTEWYDRVASLDASGNIQHDPVTGDALYLPGPKAGQPFEVPPSYDQDNDSWLGKLPSDRRFPMSPLFDQSAVAFSFFRELVNKRLKCDIGNPRDPKTPTQIKVDK